MPKILVIRFSSIGDIVLTTPVIRCLKQQVHDIELHYITKRENESLLIDNPHIHRLHFLQSSFWETVKQLRAEKFDYIIDLHNNQRTLLIKIVLGVPAFSFPKLNFEKWLMVNFKINRLPKIHIVDRYFETVSRLNVVNDKKGLDFYLDLKKPSSLTVPHEPYIAWVIGAKQKTKQYPPTLIVRLLNDIRFPNLKVVLLGGKDDVPDSNQILSAVDNSKIVSYVGMASLQESARLIKLSSIVISNDTGLMHIAAAFQKPILSIWGNTIADFGMTPYYGNNTVKQHRAERNDVHCRPCSKLGYESCPQKHFHCMQKQSAEEIIQQLKFLLEV